MLADSEISHLLGQTALFVVPHSSLIFCSPKPMTPWKKSFNGFIHKQCSYTNHILLQVPFCFKNTSSFVSLSVCLRLRTSSLPSSSWASDLSFSL